MSASAALHYFTSQAFFLVNVDIVDYQGVSTAWSIHRVGFSPLGMLILTITGFVVCIIAGSLGLRKLDSNMPVASSCSASISAACHPSSGKGIEHHLQEIGWGVELATPTYSPDDDRRGTVGHCTFSSAATEAPKVGLRYR